jgi:osmotically-inducible protein OsmY
VRSLLPQRLEDRVKARLESDRKLEGVALTVTSDGGTVKLSGVVPDAATRKWAVELAENNARIFADFATNYSAAARDMLGA